MDRLDIYQEDIPEQNAQVSRMVRTYLVAEEVLTWAGIRVDRAEETVKAIIEEIHKPGAYGGSPRTPAICKLLDLHASRTHTGEESGLCKKFILLAVYFCPVAVSEVFLWVTTRPIPSKDWSRPKVMLATCQLSLC